MLTKADFQKAITDSIAGYPAIAPLYHAGDPRILQSLEAMATMLSMFSAQVEVAQSEPFEKVRDATILADAAMRGIIRKASPARVRVIAKNNGAAPYTVESERVLLDAGGLSYRVETAVTVAPGAEGTFEAVQVQMSTATVTVAGSVPFYAIPIPPAADGSYLASIAVRDAQGYFVYRDRYVNTAPGERVFHVEADDRQQVHVRFGHAGIVGVQPAEGDIITLELAHTAGEVNPAFGSPFSFDYLAAPAESAITLKMDALLAAGQAPMSMETLRDLARYPSVYDASAVFLGEFDFLVRRNFPNLRFLSVWNEADEETARGANADNINALFVACLSQAGTEAFLSEPDPLVPVAPTQIATGYLTATQKQIAEVIRGADDSYRIYFVTPVRSKIAVTVNARVSTAYVSSVVREQIIEALLAEYGEAAAASRRGRNRPLYQGIYALLKKQVPALAGQGADLTLNIASPASTPYRPELWRFIAPDSLTVTVETVNAGSSAWGA